MGEKENKEDDELDVEVRDNLWTKLDDCQTDFWQIIAIFRLQNKKDENLKFKMISWWIAPNASTIWCVGFCCCCIVECVEPVPPRFLFEMAKYQLEKSERKKKRIADNDF